MIVKGKTMTRYFCSMRGKHLTDEELIREDCLGKRQGGHKCPRLKEENK
jgi:hypothetical protein